MSSRRPTKGEMKEAPALAASKAWLALKHSVTLTIAPSARSALQALRPSMVRGTLTVTFLAIFLKSLPSRNMPAKSRAVTSALTGPSTILQISAMTSLKGLPDFAIRDGLVVTPSRSPASARSRISATSAVSTKNFIVSSFHLYQFAGINPALFFGERAQSLNEPVQRTLTQRL